MKILDIKIVNSKIEFYFKENIEHCISNIEYYKMNNIINSNKNDIKNILNFNISIINEEIHFIRKKFSKKEIIVYTYKNIKFYIPKQSFCEENIKFDKEEILSLINLFKSNNIKINDKYKDIDSFYEANKYSCLSILIDKIIGDYKLNTYYFKIILFQNNKEKQEFIFMQKNPKKFITEDTSLEFKYSKNPSFGKKDYLEIINSTFLFKELYLNRIPIENYLKNNYFIENDNKYILMLLLNIKSISNRSHFDTYTSILSRYKVDIDLIWNPGYYEQFANKEVINLLKERYNATLKEIFGHHAPFEIINTALETVKNNKILKDIKINCSVY